MAQRTVTHGESYWSIARDQLGSNASSSQVGALAEAIAASNGGLGVLRSGATITIPNVRVSEDARPSVGFMEGANALTKGYQQISSGSVSDTTEGLNQALSDTGYQVTRFGDLYQQMTAGGQPPAGGGGQVSVPISPNTLPDGSPLSSITGSTRPAAALGRSPLSPQLEGAPESQTVGPAGRSPLSPQLAGAPGSQTVGAQRNKEQGGLPAFQKESSGAQGAGLQSALNQPTGGFSLRDLINLVSQSSGAGAFTGAQGQYGLGPRPPSLLEQAGLRDREPRPQFRGSTATTQAIPEGLSEPVRSGRQLSEEAARRIPRQYLPDLISAQQSAASIAQGEFPTLISENARVMLGYSEQDMRDLGYVREGNRWLTDPVAALQYDVGGLSAPSGGGGGFGGFIPYGATGVSFTDSYSSSLYSQGYAQPRGGGSLGRFPTSGFSPQRYISSAVAGLINWRSGFG